MNSARIYLWEGIFLYVGRSIKTSPHTSHAFEIGISLDYPIRIQDEKDRWHESRLMMIAPEYNHACSIPDVMNWAHIGIESESSLAKAFVAKFMTGSEISYLNDEALNLFAVQLKQILIEPVGISQAGQTLENLLSYLLGEPVLILNHINDLDYRIKKVIAILKESKNSHPPLHDLADQAGLSGGRLVHLFKEQVGIPIRKYMLWLRLRRAISEMTVSANLTDAALKAGFADSAHFSRTFMRVFGRPPSEILKNSQIVQDFRIAV